jgi:uncharacterized protein YkwD
MKKVGLVILAIALAAPLAQGEGPIDETRFTLREEMLRLVNRDRKQFGLPPVQLDPFASEVADGFCRQQIKERVAGHFGLDGQAPYMRYSFAGGNDGISENTAAWSAPYSFGDRALYEMVRRSHEAMMSEVAPHDGHRRAILDPAATHVGIGLAWERGEFRIAQEFVRRYVSWSKIAPRTATLNDNVVCVGRPVSGFKVGAITVHHEPLPEPMSATLANKIETYSLPDKRREYLPRLPKAYKRMVAAGVEEVTPQYGDGRRGDFAVTDDGTFTFRVPFNDGPGIYTVVVWVARNGDAAPIAASNVSMRVGDAARVSYSSQ